MSSHEPSPGEADTAQTLSRNRVVVTRAGFTRAMVPRAPLLVDDFNNNVLSHVRAPRLRQGVVEFNVQSQRY